MSLPLKVFELLSASELEELETFAREPGRIIDELEEWFASRGHKISRSAVWKWKTKFDEERILQRYSRNGELVEALKHTIDRGGTEALAEAAVKQLTQVVWEQAIKLEQDGDLDPADVLRWTRSLKNLVGANSENEGLKRELAEEKRKSAEALAAAAKAAADGKSGVDVVETIKKALGITVAA